MSSTTVQRYVPVHRRSPSASSSMSSLLLDDAARADSISASPVTTYSRDELLALMPDASSHSLEPHYIHQHQASEGWTHLNNAIKDVIKTTCPEIVLNRKTRKALEYQTIQSKRSHSHTHTKSESQRSPARRPPSPSSSTTSLEDDVPAKQVQAPSSTPAPTSRSLTPCKRTGPRAASRRRPTPRTRHNGFMLFHKQIATGSATESDWRRPTVAPAVIASH